MVGQEFDSGLPHAIADRMRQGLSQNLSDPGGARLSPAEARQALTETLFAIGAGSVWRSIGDLIGTERRRR